jgi:hypothetical protein
MTESSSRVAAALRVPGVRDVRRVAELAVTPNTRDVLGRLDRARAAAETRLDALEQQLGALASKIAQIEAHQPAVLNAISSMSGASRIAMREIGEVRTQVEAARQQFAESSQALDEIRSTVYLGDDNVRDEMRPHIDTIGWLLQRVETIRAEIMFEMRYGRQPESAESVETRIVNPQAIEARPLKLNVGAGHLPIEGYVNVDMRELPGIDVVGRADDLPFELGTVDEIFSSHTVEHFPLEFLKRQLLPYWHSVLKPGGELRTVAPDLEAMIADFERGETPFDTLRSVLYGGQEYEGDTHFTGFTPASFCELLLEAGFESATVDSRNRQNGDCKEFEITARKAT